MIETDWNGQRFVFHPDGAVYWPIERAVLVADVHFGKSASFRSLGVPVPSGATRRDIDRIDAILSAFGAKRLFVLGDLLHARTGRSASTMATIAQWRGENADVEIVLIRGNHDEKAGDPPESWDVQCADPPHVVSGFALAHEPPEREPAQPTFCGHIHPAAFLEGATSSLRARCFWVQPKVCVLPAFGTFTGGKRVRPSACDRVFVMGDGSICEPGRRTPEPTVPKRTTRTESEI